MCNHYPIVFVDGKGFYEVLEGRRYRMDWVWNRQLGRRGDMVEMQNLQSLKSTSLNEENCDHFAFTEKIEEPFLQGECLLEENSGLWWEITRFLELKLVIIM